MRAYFDRTRPTIIWTPVHGEYICFYSIFWDGERRNSWPQAREANLVDVILHGALGESPSPLKRADHTGGDCAAESKYPH